MKKSFALFFLFLILLGILPFSAAAEEEHQLDWKALDTPISYYQKFQGEKITLNVYNWGEYISDGSEDSLDINAEFEALTGIQVNYTTYPSNEDLYAKLKSGATSYDIVIPSDYMVARLVTEGLLDKLDYNNIPNYRFIMENMRDLEYDPKNEYSVPYTWGTVGIIYNKKFVDEADVTSWNVLWSHKYEKKILMFRNSRDAFGIAQKLLGYSFNTDDEDIYLECADKLKEQRQVVKIYVMDEIFDKMIGEEAWLAPYYAGDYLTMVPDNPDLAFSVPQEGSNLFVDAMCVPTGAENKEAAEMYINFLNETQVAKANIEYICYSTPHQAAFEALDEETRTNPVAYPANSVMEKTEVFINLPENTNALMDHLWEEILMTQDANETRWVLPAVIGACLLATMIKVIVRQIRRKKNADY